MKQLPPLVEVRLKEMPRGLREHVECVRDIARRLAERHGVDLERVDLAAAAHDLARALKAEALLKEAKRYRLRLHPVERHKPVLLHGAVSSLWLQHEAGVKNGDVLEAVRWHTTGHRGIGQVAKVVFLADKLDPQKVARYPYLDKISSLAKESLDRALVEFLDLELVDFLKQGYLIHPGSLELRNELMAKLNAEKEDSTGVMP